jgi:UDPglucose--hexose-1-phosphate uridylyltransferase
MSVDNPKVLKAGVVRTELSMADGRIIRYYDSTFQSRTAEDQRPVDEQPIIGELRLDVLTNEWVAIAAHRQGRTFLPPKELCPLCPTKGELLTEIPDSDYEVVVFDNRFPALKRPGAHWKLPEITGTDTPVPAAAGVCEVVCFTPDHGGHFGGLSLHQIRTVMEAWQDRTRELSKLDFIQQIFPFENRGEEIGVTLAHPHGQIYGYSYLPPRTEKMLVVAEKYFAKHHRAVIDDVVSREIKAQIRIVTENEHWIAYVPLAARYPFEIHVTPKIGVPDLAALSDSAADAFPSIAKEVLTRLDGVFGIPMAYIAAWHQAPVRQGRESMRLHWQITSVRRAPGKLKYLAGSEAAMGAFIMDMKPEQSAAQLREVTIQ